VLVSKIKEYLQYLSTVLKEENKDIERGKDVLLSSNFVQFYLPTSMGRQLSSTVYYGYVLMLDIED
jgi:hypothetical protein